MATRSDVWHAAQSAVRDEVRSHRPKQKIWTMVKPSSFGLDADGWLIWSRQMIVRFNNAKVKDPIVIGDNIQRQFLDKTLLDFAKALRDA